MKRPSASALLSLGIALASAPAVSAECIVVTPQDLVEVKVASCEAPDARAREQYKASYDAIAIPSPGGAKITVDFMLQNQPARILRARRIRYRSAEPKSAWSSAGAKGDETILVLGSSDCKGYAAGTTKLLVADTDCCDTGVSNLTCLLKLPTFDVPWDDLLKQAGAPAQP
jgi:hypothetical protein